MKNIIVRIDEDVHKKFKMYCLKNDTTLQSVLAEYIENLVNEK